MWDSTERLQALDAAGYVVLEALTVAPGTTSSTFSRPRAFICIDGKTYWVKANVQQGLAVELIVGRLAAQLGVGAMARVIRVTNEALPPDGSAAHLEGIVVGSEDQPNMLNARDIGPFVAAGGQFQPGVISSSARAKVIAFQTWMGLGDSQVLVNATTGQVVSIDHGDCFSDPNTITDPSVIVTDIPGVPTTMGKSLADVRAAVSGIEAVTDEEILQALAHVPGGGTWQSTLDRRVAIGRYLAYRRERLRGVMETWSQL